MDLAQNTSKLTTQWNTSAPFPHLTIFSLLNTDAVLDVLTALSTLPFTRKDADLFTFLQTDDLNNCDLLAIRALREQLTTPAMITALQKITGRKLARTIDLHATIYEDTHYLLCHDDDIQGRALAFMIYLTDVKTTDGGSLALYTAKDGKPTTVAKRITPTAGLFICFGVGDGSYHAVEEVITDTQRIALAGWYHARH